MNFKNSGEMNGNNLLLDTNIILYFLNGEKTLLDVLESKNLFVSFITQLELLGSKHIDEKSKNIINQFLSECTVIDITQGIKDHTIFISQNYSIKLPDSIIMATSFWLNIPLVTADKDFTKVEYLDLIFFER